ALSRSPDVLPSLACSLYPHSTLALSRSPDVLPSLASSLYPHSSLALSRSPSLALRFSSRLVYYQCVRCVGGCDEVMLNLIYRANGVSFPQFFFFFFFL